MSANVLNLGKVVGQDGLGLPNPSLADVGKVPFVNSTGDGYELSLINSNIGDIEYNKTKNIEITEEQVSTGSWVSFVEDINPSDRFGVVTNGISVSGYFYIKITNSTNKIFTQNFWISNGKYFSAEVFSNETVPPFLRSLVSSDTNQATLTPSGQTSPIGLITRVEVGASGGFTATGKIMCYWREV